MFRTILGSDTINALRNFLVECSTCARSTPFVFDGREFMNRIDVLEPSLPRLIIHIGGNSFPFPHADDPRWEPHRKMLRNQLNPMLRIQEWLSNTPDISEDVRQMALEVGFQALVEEPENRDLDSPELTNQRNDINNNIKMLVRGLCIANPEHDESEWHDFVGSLTLSQYRAIRFETLES